MAVIYMPKKPMADMLPTLLSNMILQNQARSHQKQAAEENRIARLQEEGYTEEAPEGATTPDLTVGKKKLFAPKMSLGNTVAIKGTNLSMTEILRNGRIVGYKESTGKADKFDINEFLAKSGVMMTSQGPVKFTKGPDGNITEASLLVPPSQESSDAKQSDVTKYELVTYGRLSPELRGTPEYRKGFLQFQKDINAQSLYADAMNRQANTMIKREGTALRKEFYDSPIVKTYQEVSRQSGVMEEAIKEARTGKNLVAVDQALITIMNKMMDPASVVRESEYARTPGDIALMNRVKGAFQKIKTGGAGLTLDDREAITSMGRKYMAVAERKYKGKLHEYKGYLANYGLDPDKYLSPPEIEPTGGSDLTRMSDEELLKELEK